MPCTVLVVEDNDCNLELMVEVLELGGFQVLTARTTAEAWQTLQSSHVDVALLDISLRGSDGLSLARQVRATPDLVGLPLIIVSAHATDQATQDARAAGCDAYITKPIDVHTFARHIRALVGSTGGRA